MLNEQSLHGLLFTWVGLTCSSGLTHAALTIDLRWDDGTHAAIPDSTVNGSKTIYAWAVVTGSTGNGAREGLQSVIFGVQSVVEYGTISGGISSASLAIGWNGASSQIGTAQDLTNDGIGDWGNANNTGLILNTTYFRARTTKSANNAVDWGDSESPAGSLNNGLADGGREFLIGTFTFSWTSFPSGQYPNLAGVRFVPVTPSGGSTMPANWWEDTLDTSASSPSGIKTISTGSYGPVTPNSAGTNGVWIGVIPEPAFISIFILPACLARRQSRSSMS